MTTVYRNAMESPVGKLILTATEHGLISIVFHSENDELDETHTLDFDRKSPILKQTCDQLSDYFKGKRKRFNLKLQLVGTPFQLAVWKLMIQIPYGETCSYLDIAIALGSKRKARAVGRAANRNPIPIIIPCHRVIGSGGKLTGFAGGLEKKATLLNLECKRLERGDNPGCLDTVLAS